MTQMVQGDAASAVAATSPQKRRTISSGERTIIFLHSLAFVIGFGLVFTLLGSLAGLLGQGLSQNPFDQNPVFNPAVIEEGLRRVGALLLVVFGLTTLGVVNWLIRWISQRVDLQRNPAAAALVDVLSFVNGLLYTEHRLVEIHQINRGWGYLSSTVMGMGFAAGWTPCIGPILSTIWVLAAQSATVGQGAMLLAVYSIGLGIPFLLVGLAFGRATRLIRHLNRYMGVVSLISGLFLLFVAYLLWTNELVTLTTRFDTINRVMLALNEWVLAGEDWLGVLSGTEGVIGVGLLVAAPLAFFAGLLSFLSPCVLPLVPAYIGYLSGAVVADSQAR